MLNVYNPFYYEKSYCYSLFDLTKIYYSNSPTIVPVRPYQEDSDNHKAFADFSLMMLQWFRSSSNCPIYTSTTPLYTLKPHIANLMKFVYARYYTHYCIFEKVELTRATLLDNDKVQEFLANMINIIIETYDRYAKILDLYDAEKSNLMNGISSSASGTNRFNDTPQDSGEFDDDEHTTNITQTSGTSTTDGDTKIARLEEIAKLYRNTLKEWSSEFEGLFIEEINL